MAGAVNITIGAVVGPFIAGIRQAQTATAGFTGAFKQQFDGLKASAESPKGAFAELTRNLSATRRQIADIIAAGGQIPTDLASRYALLRSSVNSVNSAFDAVPGRLANIAAAGARLTDVGRNMSTFLTLPILGAGVGALKLAGDMEKASVSFTVLLGSASKSKEVLDGLKKFAADTPFEFPEVQGAAKSLLAFGVTAEKLQPTLRALGDISAGIDAPIGEIAQIFGKARVQGRLFAEDINQLTGRGIPIIQELAKQFKVTDGEVKKLVEDGRVGFGNLETAFINLTKEGGKFGGLMKAQSETLPGLFSTLKDSAGQAFAAVGQSLAESLKLKDAIPALAAGITSIAGVFNSLTPSSQNLIFAFAGVAAAAGPVLFTLGSLAQLAPVAAKGFGLVRASLLALSGPVGIIIAASAAVVGVGVAIFKYNQAIKSTFDGQKILADVTREVADSVAAEKIRLDALLSTAKNEKLSKDQRIRAITDLNAINPLYQNSLTLETINTKKVTEATQQYVTALTAKARAQAFESRITKAQSALLDAQLKKTDDYITATDRVGANFATTQPGFTAPNLQNGFKERDAFLDAIKKRGEERRRVAISDEQKTVNLLTEGLNKLLSDPANKDLKLSPITAPAIDFTGSGTSGIQALKNELKAAKSEVQSIIATKGIDAVPADKLARVRELSLKLKEANDAVKLIKPPRDTGEVFRVAANDLEFWTDLLDSLEKRYEKLSKAKSPIPPTLAKDINIAKLQVEKFKAIADSFKDRGIDLKVRLTQTGVLTDQKAFQGQVSSVGGTSNLNKPLPAPDLSQIQKAVELMRQLSGPIALPKLFDTKFLGVEIAVLDNFSATIKERMDRLGENIGSALQNAAASAATGMGELIGGMIAGTASLSDIPKAIGGIFADLAKSMGQALIAFGTAGLAAKAFVVAPGAAIIAGIALTALGAGLQASFTKSSNKAFARPFATGGIVYGPTLGLVGEYSGARNNPEVIAPLDKLKSLIGDTGNAQVFIPNLVIRGEDMIVAFDRAQKSINGR